MDKSADAFRTIAEAAEELQLPQHVLRFWETRFPQIKPLKRGGGRRYYRPRDIETLRAIKRLLYAEGYTIKGVQRVLKEQGIAAATARNGPDGDGEDFPSPVGHGLQNFQDPSLWQDGCAESGMSAPAGQEPLGFSPPPRSHDDVATITAEGSMGGAGLTAGDTARLRAALEELAQCQAILAAARHR
jgi:DNA-binding transcriptional MerR regulator